MDNFITNPARSHARRPREDLHRVLPGVRGGVAARALAQTLRQPAVGQGVEVRGHRLRGRGPHQPIFPVAHQLRRPPAVHRGHDRLARAEGLQGHEAVVLVPRREEDGAAARVVVDELRLRDRAQHLHAPLQAEVLDALAERPRLLPLARDLDGQAAVLHARGRLHQEAEALERGQARHREDVVAVSVRAVRPLRRRRVEQLARDAAEALQPRLDGLALRDQPSHVAREQPAVEAVEDPPPNPLLEPALPAQPAREALPQVVVLAHAVVEPAHVVPVAHRVGGEAQRDHLVDGLAVRGLADVGQPVRPVGRELAPEAVLRRDHDLREVSGAAQRGRRLFRDGQVAAADEEGAGGDDQDPPRTAHGAGAGSRVRTTRAGTPTATAPAGRSSVTTAPAPTTTWWPMVTPSMTFAPAPSHTFSPSVIPAERRSCSTTGTPARSNSWPPPTRYV